MVSGLTKTGFIRLKSGGVHEVLKSGDCFLEYKKPYLCVFLFLWLKCFWYLKGSFSGFKRRDSKQITNFFYPRRSFFSSRGRKSKQITRNLYIKGRNSKQITSFFYLRRSFFYIKGGNSKSGRGIFSFSEP